MHYDELGEVGRAVKALTEAVEFLTRAVTSLAAGRTVWYAETEFDRDDGCYQDVKFMGIEIDDGGRYGAVIQLPKSASYPYDRVTTVSFDHIVFP